jgi:hypothetical protein
MPKDLVARLFAEVRPNLPKGFVPSVAVVCPFCEGLGRECIYIFGEMRGDIVLCHSEPTCCEFRDREPDDFMEAARFRMTS